MFGGIDCVMSILALDLGGTNAKCFRFDDKGRMEVRTLPTLPNVSAQPMAWEIDAQAYYQQILTLMEGWTEAAQALLFSTQMHGYVLTDEKIQPLSNYISWRDALSLRDNGQGTPLAALRTRLAVCDITGLGVPIKGNLALSALWARRENLPPRARLCSLGGYLIGRLTGELQSHVTNAAALGLMDVRHKTWRQDILSAAGLCGISLPRLTCAFVPVGTWQGIAVYPDLGDQQVCALGAGLIKGLLHVNIGTAGLIGCLADDFIPGVYENRPWLESGCLRTISGLPGGRHLEALALLLQVRTGHDVWAEMARADEAVPDSLPAWDFDHPSVMLALVPNCTVSLAASWFYRDFARRYQAAARQLSMPLQGIAYSGGCALRNLALRRALQKVLNVREEDCRSGDVSDGLRIFANTARNQLTSKV